jgi:hypothetical protein
MKKVSLLVMFCLTLLVAGCSSKMLTGIDKSAPVVVEVEREQPWWVKNSILIIAAKDVTNDGKEVVVDGLISITTRGIGVNEWVVSTMEVRDNKLVVVLPKDTEYSVRIKRN